MAGTMTLRNVYAGLVTAAGIDRAVGLTLVGRGWVSVAGLVGLVAVGRWLSRDEQGYYYTFYSLLALQAFAELGLSNVILQFASHEAAHLEITPRGILNGPSAARSRLASVLRFSLKWYGLAAASFSVCLLIAGFAFFTRFSGGHTDVAWKLPWTGTVLAAAGLLLLTPIPALLQGCGMVADVALCRLLQALAAHTALWAALWLGAGLASAVVYAAVNLVVVIAWLGLKYRGLLTDLWAAGCSESIPWRTEIWPYQWRIAISWLCGYFIFQLFTPLMFAFQGPIEAGRMGMTLAISAAVSTMGMSWLSTKAPRFGALVSLRRFDELDNVFARSTRQAVAVSVLCAGAILTLSLFLHAVHHPFTNRFLPTWPLAFLLLANVVNLIVGAEATYLRAFKQEPFLGVSLLIALLNAVSATVFAMAGSTAGMTFAYLTINVVIGLGLGTWVYRNKRRLWQRELRSGSDTLVSTAPLQGNLAA